MSDMRKNAPSELVCTGTQVTHMYPFGEGSRPAIVRVVLGDDPAAIGFLEEPATTVTVKSYDVQGREVIEKAPDPKPRPFCASLDGCKITQMGDEIDGSFRDFGNNTYRFTLNKKTGALEYGGGGLDGGWAFQGSCTAKS